MQIAPRPLTHLALFAVACMLSACTGPAAVIGIIGVATDTSASWSIVKHIHDKWVEGGPVPCYRFDNTVERSAWRRRFSAACCGCRERGKA